MLDFTKDVLPYLSLGADKRPPAKLRHAYYQASIDHRDRLRAVFGKAYPYYLDLARPKERDEYKLYRRRIYKNPLRSLRRRVTEVLDYIRQADDFEVSFPAQTANMATDNLESYLTDSRFTNDGDAVSWFFKHVRKGYVNDPNAVLVVLPMEQPNSDTVRTNPVPVLINSECVYQFRNNELAVLESPERTWIQGGSGLEKTGRVLLFLDTDSYCIARQRAVVAGRSDGSVDGDKSVVLSWDVTGLSEAVSDSGEATGFLFMPLLHNCPVMPARKIGKLQEEQAEAENRYGYGNGYGYGSTNSVVLTRGTQYDPRYTTVTANDTGEEFYESVLADALPHIEAAQGVQSDIEVERNFHVSSQEWRYAQRRCPDSDMAGGQCHDGKIPLRNGEGLLTAMITCPTCKGQGMDISGSGLGLIIVSAPQATNLVDEGRPTNLPTPPGGFIPRSIEPLKEFVLEFEREKKQAYETINMQFLMETPINQSGVAKRADREELYRTLIVEGAHLCGLLQFMLECAACERKQEDQKPDVLIPVRLNIENSEITRDELVQAVEKQFDANLRRPLEKKLIAYQVGEDSDYYRRYELKERIDPYPDLDFEKKLFLLATARATMQPDSDELKNLNERIALSIHFNGLVSDMMRASDSFLAMDVKVQYEKLLEAARLLTGLAKPVNLDPKTGLPNRNDSILAPIVDIKNMNQLH